MIYLRSHRNHRKAADGLKEKDKKSRKRGFRLLGGEDWDGYIPAAAIHS